MRPLVITVAAEISFDFRVAELARAQDDFEVINLMHEIDFSVVAVLRNGVS